MYTGILLYNFNFAEAARLRQLLPAVSFRSVKHEEYALPMRVLISGETSPASAAGEAFADKMVILSNLPDRMAAGCVNMIRSGVPGDYPIGMVTAQNRQWTSTRLHDNLMAEHRMLHRK